MGRHARKRAPGVFSERGIEPRLGGIGQSRSTHSRLRSDCGLRRLLTQGMALGGEKSETYRMNSIVLR
jgi:hypothetical protein